ncbi:MAG: radical SAM protein [Elusimicrobiota bacterium]
MKFVEDIKIEIDKKFPLFGVNKKREIVRLIYEIKKREEISTKYILDQFNSNEGFNQVKKKLLSRRFPEAFSKNKKFEPYLPKIKISEQNFVQVKEKNFYPERIYFDRESQNSSVLKKAKEHFEESEFIEIPGFKEYCKNNKYDIQTYNNRRKNLFIVKEKYDFFKRCPCTKGCISCNYYIFNIGFGCPYECTYCYLQEYTNSPGIVIPSDIQRHFNRVQTKLNKKTRMGSGEFADSLALDHITNFSSLIIDRFRKFPEVVFEFKTKSTNIKNILKSIQSENIVVSWSVNPQNIIDENEFYSASLEERINAAEKCVKAGFRVGFHFDPIFYYPTWEEDYKEVVEEIFDNIPKDRIAWISLGTFRFKRELKKIIENRFPENNILDEELMIGFDGKLRYSKTKRKNIYQSIVDMIKKSNPQQFIYLCMENNDVWKSVGLKAQWEWF